MAYYGMLLFECIDKNGSNKSPFPVEIAAFSKSANNNKMIFKLCCNNAFKEAKVELMILSLFDKFKRHNF